MVSVYCITNLVNGKRYVGVSKNVVHRWQVHRASGAHKSSQLIHRAMAKHGLENFVFGIVAEYETSDEAFEEEKRIIAELGSQVPAGYNLTGGGEGHSNPTEENRRIMAERRRALNLEPEFAKRSSETIQKLNADPEFVAYRVACNKKKHEDPEFKNGLRERMRNRFLDPEFAAASSERARLRWQDPEFRETVSAACSASMQSKNANPEFQKKAQEGKRAAKARRIAEAVKLSGQGTLPLFQPAEGTSQSE